VCLRSSAVADVETLRLCGSECRQSRKDGSKLLDRLLELYVRSNGHRVAANALDAAG
jgi:hypothetical protein